MSNTTETQIGVVVSVWRYPVKSMLGERLNVAEVAHDGLLGDRYYGLVDRADGKVATAKNPRKWPNLFSFRATFLETPEGAATTPRVRITLPDGGALTTDQKDCEQALSKALKRDVTLGATARASAVWTREAEEYWPDMEGLDHRDTVTDFALPAGTFFDCATVHLLTTTTLDRLRDFYPQGRFEIQRFRPNIVVEPSANTPGFIENTWIGSTLAIGDQVRLRITAPCGRCVMTTLAQGELPQDPQILRTAVQRNQGQVGVYAAVDRGGTIRRDDRVRILAG